MLANRPTVRLVRTAMAAITAVAPQVSWAAPPPGSPVVTDSGDESCPRAQDVCAEIVRLVPSQELHRLDPPVRIQIDDEGESYVVRVFDGTRETQREHRDEGRHCAARARFAAVFAVLRLMPPEVMLALEDPATRTETEAGEPEGIEADEHPAKPDDESASEAALAPPQRKRKPPRGPGLGAAVRYSWITPAAGAIDYLVPGVELHVSIPVLRSRWLPVVNAGADLPTRFESAERGIEADVGRGDLGLGLRYQNPHKRLVPWFDGLVMGRLARWRGRGLIENRTSWEFAPGFRLGAGLGLRWGRVLVPCLEARGALYPISSAVTAQPGGSLGRTAAVELGIAAGARWLP